MRTKRITCQNCSGHGYITAVYKNGQSSAICPLCDGAGFLIKPMTNADRIRASDKSLAEALADCTFYQTTAHARPTWAGHSRDNIYTHYEDAVQDWLNWLQQPAEED